jgi:hypothetical protein
VYEHEQSMASHLVMGDVLDAPLLRRATESSKRLQQRQQQPSRSSPDGTADLTKSEANRRKQQERFSLDMEDLLQDDDNSGQEDDDLPQVLGASALRGAGTASAGVVAKDASPCQPHRVEEKGDSDSNVDFVDGGFVGYSRDDVDMHLPDDNEEGDRGMSPPQSWQCQSPAAVSPQAASSGEKCEQDEDRAPSCAEAATTSAFRLAQALQSALSLHNAEIAPAAPEGWRLNGVLQLLPWRRHAQANQHPAFANSRWVYTMPSPWRVKGL